MTYSDDDIVAYIYKSLDKESLKRFKTQLEHDADLQKRVKNLSEFYDKARADYDNLLIQSPKAPVFLEENRKEKSGMGRIAASVAALFMAGLIGYNLSYLNEKPSQNDWVSYVAAYQALYANPTLVHIKRDVAREEKEISRVSTSLGKTFNLESLTGFQKIDYKRAQILSYEGKPLIQFTYLSKLGAPLALCVIKSSAKTDEAPSYSVKEKQSTALWSKGGYDYILIGGRDQNIIKNASEYFYKTL